MGKNTNLSMTIGDDETLKFTFLDSAGDAFDIESYTFALSVKKNETSSTDIITKTDANFTKASNVATVIFSDTDTTQDNKIFWITVTMTLSGATTSVITGDLTFKYEATGSDNDTSITIGTTDIDVEINLSSGIASIKEIMTANGDFIQGSGSNTYRIVKNNLAATVAPTANEDSGDGYTVSSRWYDTTNDKEYVCMDSTLTAAVWVETTAGAAGGETNTASSAGTGVPVYKGKTGVNIDLNAIKSENNLLGVALDAVSNDIELTVSQSNINSGVSISASQVSDFDTEVANNSAVSANTSKVTNATHTGDVTGSGDLTLDKTAITGKSTVTALGADSIIISDASDSGNLKKALLSDISEFTLSSPTFTGDSLFSGTGNKIVTFQTTTARTDLIFSTEQKITDDIIGQIIFKGLNSLDVEKPYTAIISKIIDPTSGSEDSAITFHTYGGSFYDDRLTIYGDKIGINTLIPTAKLEIVNPTATIHQKWTYDVSNYMTLVISSAGNATFAPSGGNLGITGITTFSAFPITPSSAPTTDYQVANKKYIDDNSVFKNTFDANTILAATTDDTPTALEVTASTFVGRKATGNISAMSVTESKTLLGVETALTDDDNKIPSSGAMFDELSGRTPNVRTDNYELVDGDRIKHIIMNKGTAVTLTIPAYGTTPIYVNAVIPILNIGAGELTIAITTDTLSEADSQFKLAQGRAAYLYHYTNTVWWLVGETNA